MPRLVSQPDRRFESGSTIRHNSRVETCTQRKPMIDFHGKVALITGATSGIGEATAVMFARYSARVVIAGRRDAEGERVVEGIKAAFSVPASFFSCHAGDSGRKGRITINGIAGITPETSV